MLSVFFRSLRLHLLWWIRSVLPTLHPAAPLSMRRWLLILIAMPFFTALQLVHWIGFLIDELCFRDYRKIKIEAPLFITGIPRSGTTFLHRTLAMDTSAYCSVVTWEAILAPSITERKVIAALIRADKYLGSPFRKVLNRLIEARTGDFNAIHEIGLNAPEEDYLWLLPAGGCFILSMAFPFSAWLRATATPQKMTDRQRRQFLDFYISCIRRHLYYHGSDRRFLSKNAAFAGWIGPLAERFPDARFLVCIRQPLNALSSQLRSLQPARRLFATDPEGTHTKELMTTVFRENYGYLSTLTEAMPPEQLAYLNQSDMRTASGPLIKLALHRLSLPIGNKLDQKLQSPDQESGIYQNKAADSLLNKEEIEVCLLPSYKTIMQSRHRIELPNSENGP